MESADFRSICQETIQTILKKEQQLEYANEGFRVPATQSTSPVQKEVAALIEQAARHAQDQ